MPPKKKVTGQTVQEILASAKVKFGDKLTVGFKSDVNVISSGSIALDEVLDVGGIPEGRSHMFVGPPSSGKTSAALTFAGVIQKRIREEQSDQIILYLDYECALDEEYAEALGFDISDEATVLMVRPDDFETGANLARAMIEAGKVRLVIWDSIPSMIPSSTWTKDSGEVEVAPLPRLLGPFLGLLNPLLMKHNCTNIMINHVTEKIGGAPGFGPPAKVFPGGVKAQYYSSTIVMFTRVGGEKGKSYNAYGEEQEVWVANKVKITTTKNKVGRPNKELEGLIRFGSGFDNLWTAIKILRARKFVTGDTWITFDPEYAHPDMNSGAKIQGQKQLQAFIQDHPEWAESVVSKVQALLDSERKSGKVVPVTASDDSEEME